MGLRTAAPLLVFWTVGCTPVGVVGAAAGGGGLVHKWWPLGRGLLLWRAPVDRNLVEERLKRGKCYFNTGVSSKAPYAGCSLPQDLLRALQLVLLCHLLPRHPITHRLCFRELGVLLGQVGVDLSEVPQVRFRSGNCVLLDLQQGLGLLHGLSLGIPLELRLLEPICTTLNTLRNPTHFALDALDVSDLRVKLLHCPVLRFIISPVPFVVTLRVNLVVNDGRVLQRINSWQRADGVNLGVLRLTWCLAAICRWRLWLL